MKRLFNIATEAEIKKGRVTDVYFERVLSVLRQAGVNKRVVAEVRAASLPTGWPWAVFTGLDEVLNLLSGLDVDVYALDEGSLFYPGEPVLFVEGPYNVFGVFETALLGLLCQAGGIATKAARCFKAAAGRPVYSFGARRMHPALAPMIERSAVVGGCAGFAAVVGGKVIDAQPIGTMSHSLMLNIGSDVKAWLLFDKFIDDDIKRIALVDTFADEKFAAVEAAKALGERLFAVRLDTPASRRGDFAKIAAEVRWELDMRGYEEVKIFLSGGLNEESIQKYNNFADAYGVGTAVSNAPVVDFSLDIVEVEGRPLAKRGKKSGKKQVFTCPKCGRRWTAPFQESAKCPACNGAAEAELKLKLERGALAAENLKPTALRRRVIEALSQVELV